MSLLHNDVILDYLSERGLQNVDAFRPYELEKTYYFRCVVYSMLGTVVGYSGRCLILNNASYVGTDGRYGQFVREGSHPNLETEYAGDGVVLNTDVICDATPYLHDLPKQDQ